MMHEMATLIDDKGLRIDGRKVDELRPLKIEAGLIKNADGSAYIEMGKNKIMAAVYGPKEVHPKHLTLSERALLRCRYHMSAFSTDTRKNPAPSRREHEISKVLRDALLPAVLVEDYPRTAIDVYVEILQSDGGSRCAGLTAASVALADAGIGMRDLVVGCAAGKLNDQVVLDLNDTEDKEGSADLPIGLMPTLKEVTLLQLDGMLNTEEFQRAFDLAVEGCLKVYQVQRAALIKKYFGAEEVRQEVKQ